MEDLLKGRGLRILLAILLGASVVAFKELRSPRANGNLASAIADSSPETTAIGQASVSALSSVNDFELRDAFGTAIRFSELQRERPITAVIFWGCDCPLVRQYASTLNEIEAEFAPRGVRVIAVNSNVQDSPTAIERFIQVEKIAFPIFKDPANVVADLFRAERTPEAFLVDSKGQVLYRGRIDDQHGVGYRRPSVQQPFLRAAIEAVLANRPVATPRTEAVGCLIGRSTKPKPQGSITYARDIAPILQKRCEECHRDGEVAPFPLSTYEQAYGWAEMIREVVDQGRMPPWFAQDPPGHFQNDPRLSPEEKTTLFQWIDDGCPQGNPRDAPPPATYAQGWSIPTPDAIFRIADRPIRVPAQGPWDYQNFFIETGFDEDKWIVAAEARPGNRKVVHHVAIWILRDGMPRDDYSTSPVISFAPGMPPLSYPEGSALLLPKRATLRYQIHYEPCGYETEDLSTVGFVFGSPDQIKSQVVIDAVFPNDPIHIPPGDGQNRLNGYHYFARDAVLFGLMPHMHLRGKSFRYILVDPNQQSRVLLDLPRWDFGWQFWYLLTEPILVPRGSVLKAETVFDNSPENQFNPDARQTVKWGPKTSDEMTVGIFAAIDPASQGKSPREYLPPREGFSAVMEEPWHFDVRPPASADWKPGPHLYGLQTFDIAQPAEGAILFRRRVASLRKGWSYSLAFRVQSTQPGNIRVQVADSSGKIALDESVATGTGEQYFRREFYSPDDLTQPEIRFDLGKASGQVLLNNVVLLQGFHR